MDGDARRWLVLAVVAIGAAVSIYYRYEQARPCVQPVVYSIGSVDPRFNTNTAQLKSDLAVAAAVWNKAAGKTLFTYADSGGVSVNLVYDDREAVAKQGSSIAAEQANLDAMHTRIESERGAISSQADTVRFNQEVDAYNAQVRALNAEVKDFNKSAGTPFEEGEYVRDNGGERINVFEFVDNDQLERVLAHELGHALGLDHNDNPDSIMYAENESGSLVPTADDVAALTQLCGSALPS